MDKLSDNIGNGAYSEHSAVVSMHTLKNPSELTLGHFFTSNRLGTAAQWHIL